MGINREVIKVFFKRAGEIAKEWGPAVVSTVVATQSPCGRQAL